MNFSKYKIEYIVGIIILIAFGYLYYTKPPKYIKDSEKELSNYQNRIYDLESQISSKDSIIIKLNNKVDSVDDKNSILKDKIRDVSNYTQYKIEEVEKYNKKQVDEYLSNRYEDSVILNSSENTAKSLVKDLVIGDGNSQELSLTREQLKNTENKIDLQSNIISKYKEEKVIYDSIIITYNDKGRLYDSTIKSLNQDLKKEKRKLFFNKVGSIAIVGSLTYLLITK